MKNMNNKMAINTYLSVIESKNKINKQEEQKQNHRYKENSDDYQMRGQLGKTQFLTLTFLIGRLIQYLLFWGPGEFAMS